jgi:putative transposase
MKSDKYLLYPTREQEEILEQTLHRCRELYNAALQERRDAYEIGVRRHPNYYDDETRKVLVSVHTISYNEQLAQLPSIQEIREEYKAIHPPVLQDVLRRVDKAMRAFFMRAKSRDNVGYPRFPGRYESFTYSQTGFALEQSNLVLSQIGAIKINQHREIIATIKTCTIKREGTDWYVMLA